MKFLVLLLVFCTTLSFSQNKKLAIKNLEQESGKYADIALQIWDWAEVGYQEKKSAELLASTLEAAGFKIEKGVGGMPTAFVATYGSGKPVVGILAEFDALPGVSQKAIPRQETAGGVAGHACGHHLFGTASAAASIEVSKYLKNNSGTIKVFGTPAEEGGAGKVYMVRAGLFEDVDAVLHWHPSSSNGANPRLSLANKSAKFRFYGQPSHAAAAPEKGRSALDGVEAMNYMVNLMREHVPMQTRIHYVITRGGEAPNVVPGFAEVYYYVRHPDMEQVRTIFDRVVAASEGAAKGTNTRVEFEVIHGIFNTMPNEALQEVMHKNLTTIGGFEYTPEETAFATELMKTYSGQHQIETAKVVQPYRVPTQASGGSTDVGDVSWVVPTAGLRTATWVPGTPGHSWQAVASGGTSIGTKGMMVAAKTLALTAIDIFESPAIIQKANAELVERRGRDFVYKPLLGDRPPPLDYRK